MAEAPKPSEYAALGTECLEEGTSLAGGGARPKTNGSSGKGTVLEKPVEKLKNEEFCIVLTACFMHEEDMLPEACWRSDYLHSTLSPYYPGLVEALPTGKYTAVLFYGRRSAGEGLTHAEAVRCMTALPDKVLWQNKGPEMYLYYARRTLAEGREELGLAMEEFRRRRGRPKRIPTFGNYSLENYGHTADFGTPKAPLTKARSPLPPRKSRDASKPASKSDVPALKSKKFIAAQRLIDAGERLKAEAEEEGNLAAGMQGSPPRRPFTNPLPQAQSARPPLSNPRAQCPRERTRRARRPPSSSSSSGDSSDGGSSHYSSATSYASTRRGNGHRGHRRRPHRERVSKPKVILPKFTGEDGGAGVTYFTWRKLVETYRRTYSEDPISLLRLRQYVQQSLEGPAADLACSLGEEYTLEDLLDLFDGYYENAESLTQLHAELHSLKQREKEDIAQFAVRITRAVNLIVDHKDNTMTAAQIAQMKRERLHKGLRPLLKTSLNYMVDRRNPCTYEQLLAQGREVEKGLDSKDNPPRKDDHTAPKPKPTGSGYAGGALFPTRKLRGNTATSKSQQIAVESLLQQLHEVLEEGDETPVVAEEGGDGDGTNLSSKAQGVDPSSGETRKCYLCQKPGHLQKDCELIELVRQLNKKEGSGRAARSSRDQSQPKGESTSPAGQQSQ